MGKRKEVVIETKEEKVTMESIMEKLKENKTTFAKVSWGKYGPYIIALEDNFTRDYCEMNAHSFTAVHLKDIKTDSVPIWQCGAKKPEEINALPKLKIKEFTEKSNKEKAKKKEEKLKKSARPKS